MEELGTLERNLLAALAEADEPTESDRERVRGLVLQRVATAAGIAAATWAAGTSGAASNVAAASSVAATSAATGAASVGVGAAGVGAAATTGAGAAAATSAVTTGAVAVWKGAIAAKIVAVAVGAGLAGGAGWYAVHASTSPSHVSTPTNAAPVVVERALVTAAPAAAPHAQNAVAQPEAAKPETDTAAAHHAVTARADRISDRLGADRLGAEADLLKRAQQAINSGDNATALALAQEHAAKYPNGVLVQERIGLQAITLCRTGAHEQGVAAATRFLKANPSSPLSERVRSSCDLIPQ
ncbi:MAG TPA: hypothetical protein VL137_05995 [Polyangiaceae bacterium]|nr:hypothetical protein [Polyangiaceae bacterium]